jgi:hypothetical protein
MDATVRQYEAAIEKAGDAGDMEAVRELGVALKRHMQRQNPSLGAPESVRLGRESMGKSVRDTVRGESRPNQVYAGAGSALALAGHGLNPFWEALLPQRFKTGKVWEGQRTSSLKILPAETYKTGEPSRPPQVTP